MSTTETSTEKTSLNDPSTCPHHNVWFSREVCAEPCGDMHYYCDDCNAKADECYWDDHRSMYTPVPNDLVLAAAVVCEVRGLTHLSDKLYNLLKEYHHGR